MPRLISALVTSVLVAVAAPAGANQPCASDGVVVATPDQPGICDLTFYAPADIGPLAVFRNGDEVTGFPFAESGRFTVTRHRAVCSTTDAACWRDLTDSRAMVALTYTPGLPLMPGDVIGLGPSGVGPLATIVVAEVGDCVAPRQLTDEQCADPLGGDGQGLSCSGGAFACDENGAPILDDGHDDGGGCAASSSSSLALAPLALGLALLGRRRRVPAGSAGPGDIAGRRI